MQCGRGLARSIDVSCSCLACTVSVRMCMAVPDAGTAAYVVCLDWSPAPGACRLLWGSGQALPALLERPQPAVLHTSDKRYCQTSNLRCCGLHACSSFVDE